MAFLLPALASAQVPGSGAPAFDQRDAPRPPAAEPAAAPPNPPPAAPQPDPPPLDPPPSPEPAARPSFLHTREKLDRTPQGSVERRREAAPETPGGEPSIHPGDFLSRSSPWVDFTLTSFYLDERVGNFLNLGVQFGVYAFDRLRLSARFVAPLEDVTDGYSRFNSFSSNGSSSTNRISSRSMALLYGASVGLVVTNSKAFVFGPSLLMIRTDVEDYGTTFGVAFPFEWTTQKNLRIGFELDLGHAIGGTSRGACTMGSPPRSCGIENTDRPGGTMVLFQYYMGWSLGRL